MVDKAKENTPKQCRIDDTCFTSLATIRGDLLTRHPKNFNHLHKDSNNILSVIIILGANFHGGKTGESMNDIGKRAHVLKDSRGMCVVAPFGRILYEGYIWNVHRAVLSFILRK